MTTAFIANVSNLAAKVDAAQGNTGTVRVALCPFGSSGIIGVVYNE